MLNRDKIAREFLYATGIFDNPAEIAANPQHQYVVAAYQAADRILKLMKSEGLELERRLIDGKSGD